MTYCLKCILLTTALCVMNPAFTPVVISGFLTVDTIINGD